MTVRDDIRAFLHDPGRFAGAGCGSTPELWLAALEQVALPAIEAQQGLPLRQSQIDAWRGLADQRCGLILGPPGTGKTFTLSWMAVAFVEACRRAGRPCRVLLTGFTRAAITNLLEAVSKRSHQYFPGLAPLAYLGQLPQAANGGIELVSLKDAPGLLTQDFVIVGATSWGLFKVLEGNELAPEGELAAPIFDLVCIDEASQMVVSQGLLSLAGLAEGGRVLVAGDDRQLPPVRETHDREFEGQRIGASLYGFLKHGCVPEFKLTETFRMNAPLTDFVSERFYDGELKAMEGNRTQRLQLVDDWRKDLYDWEQRVLDPELPAVMLLHDGPPAGTYNPFEVGLACHIISLLRSRLQGRGDDLKISDEAFWNTHLAVVSPHRAQNVAMRKTLKAGGSGDHCVVETVDRIQGQERDVILASYTVSDIEFAQAEAAFIFSAERFNVTATRARSKFILIVSRRLLETVPKREEDFDAAQHLREFVYAADFVGRIQWGSGGEEVEIRTRRFVDAPALPELEPMERPSFDEPLPEFTRGLERLWQAIEKVAAANEKFGTAADYELKRELDRNPTFSELRDLMRLGYITLRQLAGRFGPFWSARPLHPPQTVLPVVEKLVRERIPLLVLETSRRAEARYDRVRDHFDWLGLDGSDQLAPIINTLVAEGEVAWGTVEDRKGKSHETIVLVGTNQKEDEVVAPPSGFLSIEDFIVLNMLEDREARWINFGVSECWADVRSLAMELDRTQIEVSDTLKRLRNHGYLLITESGRIRSRMAELAREVRYVKQRFNRGDADRRPFLVRSLRVELKDRDKPVRNRPLAEMVRSLTVQFKDVDGAAEVFEALRGALQTVWNHDAPSLAAFQERAFNAILEGWVGKSASDAFVITADTGSGKTEAALFPLIVGAALDTRAGRRGVAAVLIYPRIRLMENQAQRVVGYLAALAAQPGAPPLTAGLQTGHVPSTFAWLNQEDQEGGGSSFQQAQKKLWADAGDGRRQFPFFACPSCDGTLLIHPEAGLQGADKLLCASCDWMFAGWIGSKAGLANTPPHFFLTVTESVHQWLQDSKYGRLFGDDPDFAPPRAILADEIHLFAGIHGSQLGYMLQRLLGRAALNGVASGRAPLAIGMSATLGQPGRIWSDLTGRQHVALITPAPDERQPNPLGREYFYFIQPEVESRGSDIAGASTTIQGLMCLAHGMRRRTGNEGGFRALVFLDSIDKLKRLHSDYRDAEEGNHLSQLRTCLYDDDPLTRRVRLECCGQPEGCDGFRKGECWFFAASDQYQRTSQGRYRPEQGLHVCRRPVFSGTSGRVEEIIRQSDVVFSTSSLEVGFDDPDMTLVYQHYAPLNLASFIQRKGRGGRGANDRPVTGVTLSPYSPRDSWFFRHPARMLDAAQFEIPINMSNYFVRRGQVLSFFLDLLARRKRRDGRGSLFLSDAVFKEAQAAVCGVFGENTFASLGTESLRRLWESATQDAVESGADGFRALPDHKEPKVWREALPWVPTTLFETVNLPQITVRFTDEMGKVRLQPEDIVLAFGLVAPGNITRRYGNQLAHWTVPGGENARMLSDSEDHSACLELDLIGDEGGEPLQHVPIEARAELEGWAGKILRPTRITLETVGEQQRDWEGKYLFDLERRSIVSEQTEHKGKGLLTINPKTSGTLRGCVSTSVRPQLATLCPQVNLTALGGTLRVFSGRDGTEVGRHTGLDVMRIYWGSDIEVVADGPARRREYISTYQRFANSQGAAMVYGYRLESEGIQLSLEPDRLNQFLEGEKAHLKVHKAEAKWLRGQFLRYLCQTRGRDLNLNQYQARQLADLMITASGFQDHRQELRIIIGRWDTGRFNQLLLDVYTARLREHPVLTESRVKKLSEAMGLVDARAVLMEVLKAVSNDNEFFGAYLRTLVLHGLAIRLRQAFVFQGRGDDRRVAVHVRLPIQYGAEARDEITVAELGEHGDGTTRTFVEHLDDAFGDWGRGALGDCSNAAEDAQLQALLRDPALTGELRALRLEHPDTPATVARRLGIGETESSLQTVLRVLYGHEELLGEQFDLFDLFMESARVHDDLAAQLKRSPTVWELVGSVVNAAARGETNVTEWTRLLVAYQRLDEASKEDSLSANSRLADQIYRLSGRLCVDGCQACLHTGSDVMSGAMAEVAVSRRVLERFENWLGSSLT